MRAELRRIHLNLLIGTDAGAPAMGPSCPLPVPREDANAARRGGARRWRSSLRVAPLALLAILVAWELATSRIQSLVFTHLARDLRYRLGDGPSPAVSFPKGGPFDTRVGYTRIPELSRRLERRGFVIARQARASPLFREIVRRGAYPVYREKTQAGLRILDAFGKLIHESLYPRRIYRSFDEIPEILVRTLLFVENRSLLDEQFPHRNPTIEWKRLANAVVELAASRAGRLGRVSGGSTLATQIEKFRHSLEGRTATPRDKLRQMLSASLRAYLGGRRTIEARKRIVLDFLNTVPLGAVAGHGEVFGIGDGLWAWYGADLETVNRLLLSGCARGTAACAPGAAGRVARAYRRVLGFILAQRRPSHYLNGGRRDLSELTDTYLRLLAREGIISAQLRDLALEADVTPERLGPGPDAAAFSERKLSNALRTRLLATTGTRSLYDLDRLDLTVRTTIDRDRQAAVAGILRRLREPEFVRAAGLDGERLLGRGDLSKIVYSFTLYERAGGANLLRVQADTFDGPLNISEGIKLDLGSTAKLRTLVSYLEIMARLHDRYARSGVEELEAAAAADPSDALSLWAIRYLEGAGDGSLEAMLDAALERRYSADPDERFFTGGGVHRFSNFDHRYDRASLTVGEALRHSVNLPFVRLMRDIVRHLIAATPGWDPEILADRRDPRRARYLERFAEREGGGLLAAGPEARRRDYRWLFRTRRKRAQDRAIRIMLEVDAFEALHRQWRRLGYPFDRLVPSYATAIGSSADRPSALARLVGIILSGGIDLPTARIDSLRFGEGTPFETHFERRGAPGVRVLRQEVARAAREALRDVVENGTARRLEAMRPGPPDHPWIVGGKTGTGDHRYKIFDRRGRLVGSRPVDRAATFVFYIDDRFFGTVTAYVTGEESAGYRFTSALPVAILGVLAPALEPLIEKEARPAGPARSPET